MQSFSLCPHPTPLTGSMPFQFLHLGWSWITLHSRLPLVSGFLPDYAIPTRASVGYGLIHLPDMGSAVELHRVVTPVTGMPTNLSKRGWIQQVSPLPWNLRGFQGQMAGDLMVWLILGIVTERIWSGILHAVIQWLQPTSPSLSLAQARQLRKQRQGRWLTMRNCQGTFNSFPLLLKH